MEKKLQIPQNFINDTQTHSKDIITLHNKIDKPIEFRNELQETIVKKHKQFSENKRDIILDYFCNLYKFSMQNNFTYEQISLLFNISFFLLFETIEKRIPSQESFHEFKAILKKHSQNCEPFARGIFTSEQSENVVQFFKLNLFKHQSMQEIALTQFIDQNIFTINLLKEEIPKYLPLDEGTEVDPQTIEMFHRKEEIQQQEEEKKESLPEETKIEEKKEEEAVKKEEINKEEEKNEETLKIEEDVSSKINSYMEEVAKHSKKTQDKVVDDYEQSKKKK